MSALRDRLRVAPLAAVILTCAACLAQAPSSASAGSFTALTCHDLSGAPIGTPGWTVGAASGQFITFAANCAGGGQGAFGLTMGPNPTAEYFNGNGNTMTYSVPGGMTILSYNLQLSAFAGPCVIQSSQCANGFGQVFVNHTGQSDPNYDYRNLGNGAAAVSVGASGLSGVTAVNVGVSCDPGQDLNDPCPGAANPEAQALVSAGSFAVADSTLPSVSNVSGSLIAGGTLSGTDAISFTAADSGGGLYDATAFLDGQQVAQTQPDNNAGLCVDLAPPSAATMTFASPQPCRSAENFSIPVNTGQFSAGPHHLLVVVTDAAGDRATAYEGTITTSGASLAGVDGSLSGPRIANGQSPCAGATLSLTTNGKVDPPILSYGAPATVRGVLHCGSIPISSAHIAVSTVIGASASATGASVQTAPDGSFSYRVPKGPNRTLKFSYTAYSNDPAPAASSAVRLLVRPRIKLAIGPPRTRNGDSIQWSGTLTTGPLPRQGVTLNVEVRQGKRWKVFDQVVAGPHGHFHYSYRFHATLEPTTYTFRVALPATGSAGYPYTAGAAKPVSIHVRP